MSKRLRSLLFDAAVSCLGAGLLFCLRVAQRSSNRRQLRKCNSLGARIVAGHDLQVDNSGFIEIGDDVSFSGRALLSSYPGGAIKIGRNCFFGDNVKIVSERANILFHDDCLVGENVSIRASNHGIEAGTLIRLQPNTVADISIGRDVWIGSGVIVLAGAFVADGCVIGANSLVRGTTEPNAIYAGSPIRQVGMRSTR